MELDSVFASVWAALETGAARRKHAFHTGMLLTVGVQGPRGRIVVCRGADLATRRVWCHTDARAGKVEEVLADARAGWTFYDAGDAVQVRLEGRAEWHCGDEVARAAWERSTLLARRCYLSPLGPGAEVAGPDSGLPPELVDREPTEEEARPGLAHFGVLSVTVERVEWLKLGFEGHTRAAWEWEEGAWRGRWLVP